MAMRKSRSQGQIDTVARKLATGRRPGTMGEQGQTAGLHLAVRPVLSLFGT